MGASQCNEGQPCGNCSRRRERCEVVSQSSANIPITPRSSEVIFSESKSTNANVNLSHLKLFHHFLTSTRQTLLFAPEVWESALQLGLQSDFLMNAILCVAARHLALLRPDDVTYPMDAVVHLCRALSGFRKEISKNFRSTHADAFIATSLLLQYELWGNTELLAPPDDDVEPVNAPRDHVFAFSSSLKQVFLKSVPLILDQSSMFMPHIRSDPTDKLVAVAQICKDTLARYQEHFSYNRAVRLNMFELPHHCQSDIHAGPANTWHYRVAKIQDGATAVQHSYALAVARLCLIQSFLSNEQSSRSRSSKSTLLPELTRFITSFPVMCHGPFTNMVHHGDPHALMVLYHFYRAARILLPSKECWWAHKRSGMMETVLKEWLLDRIAQEAKE